MRIVLLMAVIAAVGAGAACQKAEQDRSQGPQRRGQLADLAPPPAETELSWPEEPQEPPATTAAEVQAADEPAPAPSGERVHVVEKGDTLYGLARRYYNDASQWRRIYEANADRLENPDRLRPGMRLVIP